ncbi:hypothetical protein NIES2135_46460 [Leptolyngbya boryana NIES-2135]|jgi:hypothetical protein|uniref:Uncharacterized protein n=1 Tax=Leptolyngbya boryana NIES-2135 TaxID=1973484 RepID=A0A1Z4JM00_LEPBY|nr:MULTISPECIES: hypothetical protein [Leptolyngbya]BAY57775.1 hypothetical protein NIES2135_46460 [Leptolyngbya boryana NIES-2135]MBD2367220.1 hypothetical protein [Leptolyngbya sp. FACHB-161]MBD2373745.1 hypothetical protein [Leptolyngbya sp. FACHB-238]MBD2398456.1 hypothetical protein [Leptolyngbya sp. FACHB-239]MBD2404047.1 hypothetical protein [Leptolyngbya sp. FACHB-402]
MTRPFTKLESITYHHSDSEDSAEIVDIARTYGDRLEKLSSTQRLDLIIAIAGRMEDRTDAALCPQELRDSLDSMSNDTLCALVIAAAHQLRADLNHERNS